MKVSDLNVGDRFTGILEIRDISLGETKVGSPYAFISAGDISGELKLKIWSLPEETRSILLESGSGNFVELRDLLVSEYNGSKELTSQAGKGISFVSREELESRLDFDINDYSLGAPFSKSYMYESILEHIEKNISNGDIKKLLLEVFSIYGEDFKNCPASTRVHHDYDGGLLYHTFNMLRVATSICPFYPDVNSDLLSAGIILHDMGKVLEYKSEEGKYEKDFSIEGMLLGHISIMSSEIGRIADKLSIDREITMNIQHMILSHHGQMDWGSPVIPKTREAIMLHQIDNLDAKMEQTRRASIGLGGGETTERVFGLGNTKLYIADLD